VGDKEKNKMPKRIIFAVILVLASISASAPTYSADSQEAIEEHNKQIAIEFYNAKLHIFHHLKTDSYQRQINPFPYATVIIR
jgi:hypothetical protein